MELYEDAVSRARNHFHCVNVCTYNKKGCKGQRIHSRNSAPFVNERINERWGRGRGREMMGEKNFPDARKMSSTICKQVLRMGPALSNETLRCNLVLHARVCVCVRPLPSPSPSVRVRIVRILPGGRAGVNTTIFLSKQCSKKSKEIWSVSKISSRLLFPTKEIPNEFLKTKLAGSSFSLLSIPPLKN